VVSGSCGQDIAASGICAQWPRDTFRLVVNAAGDALTITTRHQDSLAGRTARRGPGHRPPAPLARDSLPAPAARTVPAPPVPAGVMAGRAGPGLWGRLRQHRGHLAGRDPGSGNHRASVFRRHVGAALIQGDGQPPELLASWLDRHGPHPGWASQETAVEMAVSRHIRARWRSAGTSTRPVRSPPGR
jgi:hypothetical protein